MEIVLKGEDRKSVWSVVAVVNFSNWGDIQEEVYSGTEVASVMDVYLMCTALVEASATLNEVNYWSGNGGSWQESIAELYGDDWPACFSWIPQRWGVDDEDAPDEPDYNHHIFKAKISFFDEHGMAFEGEAHLFSEEQLIIDDIVEAAKGGEASVCVQKLVAAMERRWLQKQSSSPDKDVSSKDAYAENNRL